MELNKIFKQMVYPLYPWRGGVKEPEIPLNRVNLKKQWEESNDARLMLNLAACLGVEHSTLTQAKALCANTVRFLMDDKRCRNAIDMALKYGKKEELFRYVYAEETLKDEYDAVMEAFAAIVEKKREISLLSRAGINEEDEEFISFDEQYRAIEALEKIDDSTLLERIDDSYRISERAMYAAESAALAAASVVNKSDTAGVVKHTADAYSMIASAISAAFISKAESSKEARIAAEQNMADICRTVLTDAVFDKINAMLEA